MFRMSEKDLSKNKALSQLNHRIINGGVIVGTNDVFVYSKLLLMDGSCEVTHTSTLNYDTNYPKNGLQPKSRKQLTTQQDINDLLIKNPHINNDIKNKLKLLNDEHDAKNTTICSVCNDKYNFRNIDFSKDEHMIIEASWGYNSTHDGSSHKLILCNKCYDTHIYYGPLGKYIKDTYYM